MFIQRGPNTINLIHNHHYQNQQQCIWKNGTPVVLSTSSFDSGANAIAVDGQDVYVAGFESERTRKIARYWKNGIAAFVSNSPFDSEAFSICLSK